MPSSPCVSAVVRARRACSRFSDRICRAGHRGRPGPKRRINMSAIGVIATLRVQPGKEEAFEAVFAELAAAVRANETGNSYYRLFRTIEASVYKVMGCYDEDRKRTRQNTSHQCAYR